MPLFFPLFNKRRTAAPLTRPAMGKIRLVQAMNAAELADFGAKPGDVARIVSEIARM